jgi:hypothetical protein
MIVLTVPFSLSRYILLCFVFAETQCLTRHGHVLSHTHFHAFTGNSST